MTKRTATGPGLVKLSDSVLELKNPNQDVRDRKVFDNNEEEIGTVEDLFADEEERRVRFLDVGAGGFLGLGEKHFLIPIEAVLEVKEDRVIIDHSREKVVDSPPFDPKVVPEPEAQREANDYYGYPPIGLGSPSSGA
jgi:sporulation protein YlmC with PRC-barrel domain